MTSRSTRQFFFDLGVVQSFSRPRTPTDNASCESWMATLKCERLYQADTATITPAEVSSMIDWFIAHYNEERLHQSLHYVTPVERHEGPPHRHHRRTQRGDGADAGGPDDSQPAKLWVNPGRHRGSTGLSEGRFEGRPPIEDHRAMFMTMEGAKEAQEHAGISSEHAVKGSDAVHFRGRIPRCAFDSQRAGCGSDRTRHASFGSRLQRACR
jgi:hypothetical protein